jgi:hypothetical protein
MRRKPRWPDFLVIGAMKAGTTTLHAHLKRHPQIFMCDPKEPGYFSQPRKWALGAEWYTSLFRDASADQLCGEASTCYSRQRQFPAAAARIGKHVPGARLVYVLRDPVSRAYSHYCHRMRERWLLEGLPPVTFDEACQQDVGLIDAGFYAKQLCAYWSSFSQDRFLGLTLEELTSQPRETMHRVFAFLGVDSRPAATIEPVHENAAWDRRTARPRRGLAGWFKQKVAKRTVAAAVKALRSGRANGVAEEGAPRRTVQDLAPGGTCPLEPFTPEVRAKLQQIYEPSLGELEELLNRDLSAWRPSAAENCAAMPKASPPSAVNRTTSWEPGWEPSAC